MNNNNLDPRTIKFRKDYQGKHFFTKDNKQEFVITDARSYGDVDIEFINSKLKKNTKVGNIKVGLANPFVTKNGNLTVAFESPQLQYEGCQYKTNQGYIIMITKYIGISNVEYIFLDSHGYRGKTTLQNIKNGQVANPFHINEFGGYLGVNSRFTGNQFKFLRNIWYNMLSRASGKRAEYVNNTQAYLNVKAYSNCMVEPSWYCYGVFSEWYMDNLNKLNPAYNYEVDKDLLFPYYKQYTNGCKCYSQYTCILLPQEINVSIANYTRFNSYTTNNTVNIELQEKCENLYKNGAISLDTLNVLKRFFIHLAEYSNYISDKYDGLKNLCF
ncbi:MAG: hypothetical protein IKR19_07990 [Acholeplasmatales bacterium]|nr:hypothetical protein [Acholeplasmatales bacterium]